MTHYRQTLCLLTYSILLDTLYLYELHGHQEQCLSSLAKGTA